MPSISLSLNVGQTQRIHVAAFAQDNTNNPSQIVDTTSALSIGGGGTFAHAQAVAGDNRAFDISALAATTSPQAITVDAASAPFMSNTNRLTINLTVLTPPADNRRVDFVSADPPAP